MNKMTRKHQHDVFNSKLSLLQRARGFIWKVAPREQSFPGPFNLLRKGVDHQKSYDRSGEF